MSYAFGVAARSWQNGPKRIWATHPTTAHSRLSRCTVLKRSTSLYGANGGPRVAFTVRSSCGAPHLSLRPYAGTDQIRACRDRSASRPFLLGSSSGSVAAPAKRDRVVFSQENKCPGRWREQNQRRGGCRQRTNHQAAFGRVRALRELSMLSDGGRYGHGSFRGRSSAELRATCAYSCPSTRAKARV